LGADEDEDEDEDDDADEDDDDEDDDAEGICADEEEVQPLLLPADKSNLRRNGSDLAIVVVGGKAAVAMDAVDVAVVAAVAAVVTMAVADETGLCRGERVEVVNSRWRRRDAMFLVAPCCFAACGWMYVCVWKGQN